MKYVLFALLILYVLWGLFRPRILGAIGVYRTPRTVYDYLSHAPKRLLSASLIGANLSVTGGMIALVSATDTYGWWVVFAPITTLFGLVLFYFLHRSIEGGESRFTIRQINKFLSGSGTMTSEFVLFYSISLVFIYALILGWEIYVGTQLLGGLIYENPTANDMFLLAILIAAAITTYTYIGGFASVVETDFVQFFLCGLVLFVLLFSNWDHLTSSQSISFAAPEPLSIWTIGALIGSLVLINGTHQLVSPVNWQIGQAADGALGFVVILSVFGLTFFWGTIVWVALAFPEHPSYPELWNATEIWQRFLLVVGVSAFIMSSADSLTFGCTNIAYSCFDQFRGSEPEASKSQELEAMKHTKVFSPLFLLAALCVVFVLMELQPEIFLTLIAITGCLSVYVPVLLSAGLASQNAKFEKPVEDIYVRLLFVGCILSAAIQILVISGGYAEGAVFLVVLGTFAFGLVVVCLGLASRRKRD